MTGYILRIARNDAVPGEPDESVTVRVTAGPVELRISEVVAGRDGEHRMPPFDLHALATALIGAPAVPVAGPVVGPAGPVAGPVARDGRASRRPHRHVRVVRHGTGG
ncbi:hypothetical protein KZZ52_27820 [Dactylosporangium sp. AC04546]|uniref:hypothetical protein n=1 Tax=Dactylosporangium sp. AC04546 TaxID=2862460 RepID=UPI001EDD5E17|nr:hypothetical protein [Dactylosporangium sp. AC04546]WVK89075.1 hypothetical protein KZZ52_27820 [Dactylosporangium sp. AC04546]